MLTLYPLDFEEFLWALGRKEMAELIRGAFEANESLPLHHTALELLRTYLVTGGMPRAVLEYVEKKDFDFVLAAQKSINDAYIADMARYATPMETTKIRAAFNSIPAQLAKDNRKFQYRIIKRGARAHEYETPVDWLAASGVIVKCNKISEARMPLAAHREASSFKVYMTDTGLLCSKLALPPHFVLTDMQALGNFKGALMDNYVPYYWESQGKAEVDFVIQAHDGSIIPVEVKSGDNVRAKSLAHFINRYAPACSWRISAKNFGFENTIRSVPLYAVFCL